LKQKRQAIVDPYNIMPGAPTAEDRGDGGLSARNLLAKVEEEIKTKEAELADAQKRARGPAIPRTSLRASLLRRLRLQQPHPPPSLQEKCPATVRNVVRGLPI